MSNNERSGNESDGAPSRKMIGFEEECDYTECYPLIVEPEYADAPHHDPELLRYLYQDAGLGMTAIAEILDCGSTTIGTWRDKHDIPTRDYSVPDELKDEEWMQTKHIQEGLSAVKIADIVGCSPWSARNWLDNHGIERQFTTPDALADKGWLQEQYTEKGNTTTDIAEMLGCSSATVSRWLNRHDIEPHTKARHIPELRDEEWLRAKYLDEELPGSKIANDLGCDDETVYRWIRKHEIPTRNAEPVVELRDKDRLQELYVDEELSSYDISNRFGCSQTAVRRWLQKHDIPIRDFSVTTLRDSEWLREKYLGEELSAEEIGREVGCSAGAVLRRLNNHDIPVQSPGGRALPEFEDKAWLEEKYVEEGMNIYEVGDLLNCTGQAVYKWIVHHEIPIQPWPSGEDHYCWEGGYSNSLYHALRDFYGEHEWDHYRQLLLDRDDHTCQMPDCDAIGVPVHHIVPILSGGCNDPDLLLTLCYTHHPIVEHYTVTEVLDRTIKDLVNEFSDDDLPNHSGNPSDEQSSLNLFT